MVKIFGILIIMFSFWTVGYLVIKKMTLRVKSLESTVLMIELMSNDLRYNLLTSTKIIENLCLNKQISQLDFISSCNKLCNNGVSFPVAFKQSVLNSTLPLSSEDKSLLISVGDILGTCDVSGQLDTLNRTKTQLYNNMLQAKDIKIIKGKLYLTLFFWGGVAVAILLF